MTPFEQLMPTVNAEVETNLGDSLIPPYGKYETAPGVQLANAVGFVTFSGDEGLIDGVQPLRQRWYLKISKRLLPDGPRQEHRLTCQRLGGVVYRPVPRVPVDGGDSWLAELQKA